MGARATLAAVEGHYGPEAYPNALRKTLLRKAKKYGTDRVSQWAEEGIPAETLGKARSMDEFRERQAERPPEVPRTVEQQNEASLHRSRNAQGETDPSGEIGVPDAVRDVVSSPGTNLDGEVQSGLEGRLGTSLDHVQVHTGPRAQQACEAVDARAFAVGNHIAFGPGEYDPSSPEGQHLIAHEVVHTLQQPDAEMSMLPKADLDVEIDPDPKAEREADQIAGEVMEGGEVGMRKSWQAEVHVQRMTKWGNLPDRGATARPIAMLQEMGLSGELLAKYKRTVDEDDYEAFVTDIWRIGASKKDLGSDDGDVGEVLSSHPEKTLAEDFIEDFHGSDELAVVPGEENPVKGFDVKSENNPEFDKLIMNTETDDVLIVVEEKVSGKKTASDAITQAEQNLARLALDGVPKVKKEDEMRSAVKNLSKQDFDDAEACAIVPSGMDDSAQEGIDPDRVHTLQWNHEQLKLMHEIATTIREW